MTARQSTTLTRRLNRFLTGHAWLVYLFFYLPILVLIVFLVIE